MPGCSVFCLSSVYGRDLPKAAESIEMPFESRVVKVRVAHTRLPSVGFWSWSRFLAVSLQMTWVINPAVGCHYFPPGPQLHSPPLRGLLPISLLGKQRHDVCEQFTEDCYQTASRLRFEPRLYCAWVQHANHSATDRVTKQSRVGPETILDKGAHWRRLANTTDRSVRRRRCGPPLPLQ